MGNLPSVDLNSEYFQTGVNNHPANRIEKKAGIRYSISYLNSIKSKIPDMNIEDVADLVDYVTWTNTEDEEWVRAQLGTPLVNAKDINTTSLGNLAYLTLKAPTEELRKEAESKYNELLKFL